MSFILLANFKSHKNAQEVKSWFDTVAPIAQKHQAKIQLLVAPSFPHLSLAHSLLSALPSNLNLASQDCSPFPPGAYTGAVNAAQLKDLGVTHALIGHSERRRYFHETHQEIANKATVLIHTGLTPALCLSAEDIAPQFAALDDSTQDKAIYCFEPPADIGGTVTAPADVISTNVTAIRRFTSAPVLYGGSVTPENVTSLLNLRLDGLLVATASLDPQSFNQIIETVANEL